MIHLALASALALSVITVLPVAASPMQDESAQQRVVLDASDPAANINPTGKAVTLTASVMDGAAYVGDATIVIDPQGSVSFSAARLLALLQTRLAPPMLIRVQTMLTQRGTLRREDLRSAGVALRYNPQELQLELDIAAASRPAQAVDLDDGEAATPGNYAAPAAFSAYLNVRGSFDWVQQGVDAGLAAPVTFLDGAARVGGVVFESEANWQPGGIGASFQRRGSRFVYDDQDRVLRWTAGDLQTLARGFQAAPEISGLSISRFYSILQPQSIIRPRGNRSFQLERRSTVEVRVNNQLVRRLELDPGPYDLRDFPFTQGANDVRLTITDDAGRVETVNFNIFLDQSQLAAGLSEFGLYAGVLAPQGAQGPVYSDSPAISGFYRRGINDRLTLGANVQADSMGWMAGAETVVASGIGSFGGFASASQLNGVGSGWASIVTFQRTISRSGSGADALSFSLEARSRNFAALGTRTALNPYSYIVGGSYNATISDAVYAGFDARYSRGRDDEPDVSSVRGTVGWRIRSGLSFTGDVGYERDRRGGRLAAFLSLTYNLDRQSTVRADYDSRFNRTRLAYQTYRGTGTGAYNLNADVERSDVGAALTANGTYFTNRAELGFSHFGSFDRDLGSSTDQRTSLRFGTALAVADGAFSVGRPIQDSFAIVRAHPSLRGSDVVIDPAGASSQANTGTLGSALQPNLGSYSERTMLITAPDAPLSVDLGEGSFRFFPPYRSGYKVVAGSDYMVSAVGRLLGADGTPLTLISGTAVEAAHPEREPIALFTNASGRFGLTGLAPGRWTITMLDADRSTYDLVIQSAEGSVAMGDLRPR
ncbi:fimbrial biogenesis outer membrane usher protein [Sphingomonas japonica]|uniref:Outer membrane usher protein n=1 Tax=Sphingomonas japonica TaxID=511662 RepID=A0ABX0U0I9_9SPHN|nr:fimbrial biogenesis outer membrane usher protein [Sphingomonas japonica]NIJ23164.1 outer membrane usher protein [Sphingomonas japonica]